MPHLQLNIWLSMGCEHICNWSAYDHILYLVCLCVPFVRGPYKPLIGLLTAFTIGHSLSLACSAAGMVFIPSRWIEWLIPLTILITALLMLIKPIKQDGLNLKILFLPLFFGFIHGMGFSSNLTQLLDKEESIVFPLLNFNLGIEIGQIFIAALFLGLSRLLLHRFKPKKEYLVHFVGGTAIIVSGILSVQRWPF